MSGKEHAENAAQLKLFMSPREIMTRNWSKTEPRPRAVESGKRMEGDLDDLMPVTWVEPKDRNHDLFYKGTHGQFGSGGGGEHVGRSQQLKMFMTPREILKDYGPHDSDRWITATEQPDGIGRLGDQTSQPPLMMASRPEEFGIIPPYSDNDFEGRKSADEYAERWQQSKEKFDRGEGNDPDVDAYYEAGDPAPGTRKYTEYHSMHTEGWTDREDYLDQWMGYGGVESLKEEMAEYGFAGDVDAYLDQGETEYYDYAKSRKKFNLEDTNDPSTWFESAPQYWKRSLEQAQKPTDKLKNAARAESEPTTFSLFPEGKGASARVEGMGVEDPVTLGLDPEVNVRGKLKRPIWSGQHDVISASIHKPDVLIPVERTSETGSYGSYADAFIPHAERQKGAEGAIAVEMDRIAADADIDRAVRSAHIELMRMGEGGEEEVRRRFPSHRLPATETFWDVQPPKNLPGQQSLFEDDDDDPRWVIEEIPFND